MALQPKFVIVDSDEDSRLLLRWTLLRMYPRGVTRESATAAAAVAGILADKPDVVIVHRAEDADAAGCVGAIRAAAPGMPVLVLSASDPHSQEAKAAGATEFLKRDEWLRIRSVLDRLLGAAAP